MTYVLLFRGGSQILEIGGGNTPLRNQQGNRITFNVDIIDNPNVDQVIDISSFPWPFEDESYDGIFSKYCMEHVEWRKIDDFVKELYRVLRVGGKAVLFVPNTFEQCRKVVSEGVNLGTSELIFGSQEFPQHAGVHKSAFSPPYAKELFKKHGFKIVRTFPHPISSTDLIIEAYKMDEIFERQYFDDGTIGYLGYRDFATHYATSRIIMREKPESLIDCGGGRGYIVKLLENEGIKAVCMDISRHCFMTRVTDNFILWDAIKVPWSRKIPNSTGSFQAIGDKEFDIAFSINFLEHIPIEYLDDVIQESMRVSKRGIHGIHMTNCPYDELDKDIDITHEINESSSWWVNKFKTINPEYDFKIAHPRDLEYEEPERQPPVTIMPRPTDQRIKLNLGSFRDMFYYGWKNIDIINLNEFAKQQVYEFIQHDITKGLPYKDNEVDFIMSNHLIEHITREEGKNLLKECYRCLKTGGIIRVSTPDTQLITQKYLDGQIWEYKYINIGVEYAKDDTEAFHQLLMSGHLTIYDEEGLKKLMESVGFKDIKRVGPFESRNETIRKETISTHPSISLILEAEK